MESLKGKNRLTLRDRAKLGAIIALMAMFGAETASAKGSGEVGQQRESERKHPVFRVAERLEGRIARRQPVRVDADHDIYWSRPASNNDGRFDFRTFSPVVANIRGNERAFRLKQTGNSLRDIEARPIPERKPTLTAENILSPTFHCDTPPEELVNIGMNRLFQPQAEIKFDDPAAKQDSVYTLIGKTVTHGSRGVLIPPVTGDNHGCVPPPGPPPKWPGAMPLSYTG